MLIETSSSAKDGEVTGVFDGTTELQKNWLDFIVNLLHYKKGSAEYGIEPVKYLLKPLYCKTAGDNSVLNDLFCHIFSTMGDWQSLRRFAPRSMADVETLVTSDFPAIEATKHSIELPRASYISKHFVAYIEALVGAAPYFRTTDPRMKVDARFTKAFKDLDKQEDQRFFQYVARKLRAWFTLFPPNPSPGAGGNDEFEEGPGAGGEDGELDADGDEEEAMALSGGE